MDAAPLFRQDQPFEPGILRHALALDVALRSISCRMFVTVERVMENSRSISRWYTAHFCASRGSS